MPPVFNKIQVVPTGGAITVSFNTSPSGAISLSRMASGASGFTAPQVLYAGLPLKGNGINQFFLDYGDLTPSPLLPNLNYVYTLSDQNGTISTAPIQTPSAFTLDEDQTLQILTRLLQAAVNNGVPPTGAKSVRVTHAMPLNGDFPMPLMVIAPELLQQDEQKIGDDVELPNENNIWTMTEFVKRVFRVSVITQTAVEREYYKRLIIGVFKIACAYVFAPIGENLVHNYQAASYQVTGPSTGNNPGFYGCDVMLEITGSLNLNIQTSYGIIEKIDATLTLPSNGSDVASTIEVVVPINDPPQG